MKGRIHTSWLHTRVGAHLFRGKRYTIYSVRGDETGWHRHDRGLTTDREEPHLWLFLRDKFMRSKHAAELALHEGLHAAFGKKLSEADVTRGAIDLVAFLVRCGILQRPAKSAARNLARSKR